MTVVSSPVQYEPTFGPIGKEVYERTYSRLRDDGTKETWAQTVRRVVDGNCDLVNHICPVDDEEREELHDEIINFNIMPAGRHLWVSGVENRQFLFNCHVAGWLSKFSDHCCFVMDELMQGGGIGANYSSDLLEQISTVLVPKDLEFVCHELHDDFKEIDEQFHNYMINPDSCAFDDIPEEQIEYVFVEDTRQGWVHALYQLLNADPAKYLQIDVSRIRPRGEQIKQFGGTSSGPIPLIQMLLDVYGIVSRANGVIGSFEALEVDHAIAACVIAGNVRRSARMSIMHWNDPNILRFINLKQQDGHHWSTNISVEVDSNFWEALHEAETAALTVMQLITKAMLDNGEPGLYNSSVASYGENTRLRSTNPCGEIALEEWENCNLGHINLAQCETLDEFERRARLMSRFLMRATFGDITSDKQREVVDRNRRIGVGLYGAQEWIINQYNIPLSELYRSESWLAVGTDLQTVYLSIQDHVDEYSVDLNISRPIKTTTIAPTGTISQLSGHTAGIHPVYAKKFIRRIRYAFDDPLIADVDPEMLEVDQNSANTTIVKYNCVDPIMNRVFDQDLIESVDELTIDQQLNIQSLFQYWWADNAISFTCNIDVNTEYTELYDALTLFGPNLKGTTVFPDKSRLQQPIERVYETDMDDMIDMYVETDNTPDCVNGACPVK